jgi:hypothetical protein
MRQLVVSRKRQLERNAETLDISICLSFLPLAPALKAGRATHLDSHHTDTAHQRANTEIYQRGFGSVGRDYAIDHIGREDCDKGDIAKEGESSGIV